MKLTAERKKHLIEDILSNGFSKEQLAENYGVTKSMITKYFKMLGMGENLIPRGQKPNEEAIMEKPKSAEIPPIITDEKEHKLVEEKLEEQDEEEKREELSIEELKDQPKAEKEVNNCADCGAVLIDKPAYCPKCGLELDWGE